MTLLSNAERSWEVAFDPACEPWGDALDQADAEALLAAIRILRDHGPALGRPLVDTVKGSRHKNMKELRPGSTGRTEVRVLFAFDPTRRAILLVGGDKANAWSRWYEVNVPIADERYDAHLKRLKEEQHQTEGRSRRKGR
jgi:hypothetical protein